MVYYFFSADSLNSKLSNFFFFTSRSNKGFPGTDSALFSAGRGRSERPPALRARRRFVRRTLNLTNTQAENQMGRGEDFYHRDHSQLHPP